MLLDYKSDAISRHLYDNLSGVRVYHFRHIFGWAWYVGPSERHSLEAFALPHCALFFTVILKQGSHAPDTPRIVIDLERIEAFAPRINEKNIEM
jgi:hypothetical protein